MKQKTKAKKAAGIILKAAACLLSVLSVLICFSVKWMFDTWANLSMDELVYHLKAPLEGTNESMITEYMIKCALPALAVLLVILGVLILCRKHAKGSAAFLSIATILTMIAAGVFVYSTWNKLEVGEYIKGQREGSDFIEENYVDPRDVELTFPEQKRNLIYIFLESMETTYMDIASGGAFAQNVIPELTELAEENEDFSGDQSGMNGAYALPGSTWTMGAMFAQTSGLPLNITIGGNNMDTQESFFPGIVTMGDILSDAGYSQTLLIGSDAVFGGRELYFTDHGNYDIIDYGYAAESEWIPEDYRVWWGYEDQKLFGFAKERLQELAAQDNPFNLTMLTVDTHFEDGYVCEQCADTYGEDQYANVMACSSRQVEEFIRWVQEQDFYENTTIVISGDHLTMDKNFCEEVDPDYERKTYTTYINAGAAEGETVRTYATFDHFPTTLAAMGVEIEGNRLGLGTNLFSQTKTLTEVYGLEKESEELKKRSYFLKAMANIEENDALIGRNMKADMTIGEYEAQTSIIPIQIENVQGIEKKDIQSITVAVWKKRDQSDIQWIELTEEKGIYKVDVDTSLFDQETGEYHIHAYVVNKEGNPYMIAASGTTIE